jgi:hypothetical protein
VCFEPAGPKGIQDELRTWSGLAVVGAGAAWVVAGGRGGTVGARGGEVVVRSPSPERHASSPSGTTAAIHAVVVT